MTALIRDERVEGAYTGPLVGETLVVKANIAVKGATWDGASPALAGVTAASHASTVQRALDAGATMVGQANMHELAFGITSDNAHFGPVESPFGGMAGGSSGGTAAAIADGTATIGLGTDTGGSGRIPAAFCGCVGFRPSAGRYPGDGVLNLSTTLDTVSAAASSMERLIRLDAVLAGKRPASSRSLEGLKLGRLSSVFWELVNPQVGAIVKAAIERLLRGGATIRAVDAPDLAAAIQQTALPLVISEAKRWWSDFLLRECGLALDAFAERIASPDVAEVFRAVATDATTDTQLEELRHHGCAQVRDLLANAMEGLDALVYPTVPIAAPALHTTEISVNGVLHPLFPLLTDRALAASLSGSPAISLPIQGFDKRPLGLEFLVRPGEDSALLGLAAAMEAHL
ncbi:MAG: amidase family protein [Pseudomonadota bacterium]